MLGKEGAGLGCLWLGKTEQDKRTGDKGKHCMYALEVMANRWRQATLIEQVRTGKRIRVRQRKKVSPSENRPATHYKVHNIEQCTVFVVVSEF